MRPVFKHIDESTIAFRKDSRKQIEDRGEETGCSCLFKAVLVPGTATPPRPKMSADILRGVLSVELARR
jgi:hypothetical protein